MRFNRLVYEREPDVFEIEEDFETDVESYGLLEDLYYNELMEEFEEELED